MDGEPGFLSPTNNCQHKSQASIQFCGGPQCSGMSRNKILEGMAPKTEFLAPPEVVWLDGEITGWNPIPIVIIMAPAGLFFWKSQYLCNKEQVPSKELIWGRDRAQDAGYPSDCSVFHVIWWRDSNKLVEAEQACMKDIMEFHPSALKGCDHFFPFNHEIIFNRQGRQTLCKVISSHLRFCTWRQHLLKEAL